MSGDNLKIAKNLPEKKKYCSYVDITKESLISLIEESVLIMGLNNFSSVETIFGPNISDRNLHYSY